MTELPERFSYLELHDDLEKAIDKLKNTREDLCIIGSAGTGKSEFVKLCSDREFYPYETIVCTPTGISAVNASIEGIRAQTIHSLFKLPPMSIVPYKKLTTRKEDSELFNTLNTLIIDEISMVNSDLLTKVIHLLNRYRNMRPVRLIVIGDPSQLAPIIKSDAEKSYIEHRYGGKYFFHAERFLDMEVLHFKKIFRQKDWDFKEILNRFRLNQATQEDYGIINSRVMSEKEFSKGGFFLHVAMTNRTVDRINSKEMTKNPKGTHTFYGENRGFPPRELPAPEALKLKLGTQVMITANNYQQGYYNGLLGTVKQFSTFNDKESVLVSTNEGDFWITSNNWINFEYIFNKKTKKIDTKKRGEFSQLPLKIAYAMTSHKVQGLTLERMYLDLEFGTFSSGQLYTSLSRVKSLEGLALKRPIRRDDSKLDEDIEEFYALLEGGNNEEEVSR